MADKIVEFLFGIFKNDYLTVLFVSMFPLIELKGAIPIGQAAGVPLIRTAVLSYIGSSLVCIPLFFLLLPVFNLLKKIKIFKVFVEKVEGMLYEKAKKLAVNAQKGKIKADLTEAEKNAKAQKLIFWALFAFVAIPLPMTGVWTGTAIAVFLNIKFKDAFLALVGGNLVSGSLVTLFTFIFKEHVDIVILALGIIAALMLVLAIIKIAKAPRKTEEENNGRNL